MSSRPSRGAARLAAILDALPDALLLVNCNGTVVNANHIALETFEVPGTGLVGRGLLDLLPEFDSRRIPGGLRLRDEPDGGRTKPTRMIARRTDGTQFPVEVTSANLDGRTPYAEPHASYDDELLMLVVRDLTGTLDTEAELARSQRQTEMILRAAAEGVVGVDTAGKVVLVNPSAAQILGYRASDLGGRELHPLIHHSRADGTPFPYEESPIADTLRSGRKHRVRGQVLWAKDGRAVPVDLTTAPVRDGDQLVGAVMTFTDRRPYDALAARHAQLMAVLDESLRGPLDQLRAELGTLADDPAGQLWPEANQILHHLAAGYARMTTLVDNVLAYQRLDAGQDKLVREKVALDEVVAAGVEGAVELIGPGRAQFAVHAPAIEAEVDAERFAQALAHLIADVAGVDSTGSPSAATSASGPATAVGDSTIVVAAAQRGEVVRVEVRGPYPGGDPVHGPLVRGIVRRHGGVLQTHDLPGASGGKAYVLEVPVSADAGPVPASAQQRGPDTENLTTVMPMPTQRGRGMNPDPAGDEAPTPDTPAGGGRRARRGATETATAEAPEKPEAAAAADTSAAPQPTGRRRGPARAEDSADGPGDRPGPGGLVPSQATSTPTGRRARRGATETAAAEAPRTAFALPPGETDRPAEPTGRRARRGVAEAVPEHQIPGQATDEPSAPRTAFALPPAEADRKPAPAPDAASVPPQTPRPRPNPSAPEQPTGTHDATTPPPEPTAGPYGQEGMPGTRVQGPDAPAPFSLETMQGGRTGQGAPGQQGPDAPAPAPAPFNPEGMPGGGAGRGAPGQQGTNAPGSFGPEGMPGSGAGQGNHAAAQGPNGPRAVPGGSAGRGAPGQQGTNAPGSFGPEGMQGGGTGRGVPGQQGANAPAPFSPEGMPGSGAGQGNHAAAQGPNTPTAMPGGPAGRGAPGQQGTNTPGPLGPETMQGGRTGQGAPGQQGTNAPAPFSPETMQGSRTGQGAPGQQGPDAPAPFNPEGMPGGPAGQGNHAAQGPNTPTAMPGGPAAQGPYGPEGMPGTAGHGAPAQQGTNAPGPVHPNGTTAQAPNASGQGGTAGPAVHAVGTPGSDGPAGQGAPGQQGPHASGSPEGLPGPRGGNVADADRSAKPAEGEPVAQPQVVVAGGGEGEAAQVAPAPTGRRRARRALAEEPGAAGRQGGAEAAPAARAISVRPLGQGPGAGETPPNGTPSPGSGRRRKLANPSDGEREAQAQAQAAQAQAAQAQAAQAQAAQAQAAQARPVGAPATATPPATPAPAPAPAATPGSAARPEGRAFAIGAPDEGAEGPEPLDGPNGAVEVVDAVRPPMDDELPPEPLDNPRRLLVWPAPDASTEQALTERGYRPVIVHSREEVNAQIAAYPAALFVDPLTGPITRTALQSLREAAVAAEVPVLVTAGLGHATREAAYGADPAVLLKALAPRDSEMHPPRVLLIEEHEPIANALTATLERRGMHVVCGATDAEAVTLAAQTRPNLVVMDLMQVRRRRAGIVDWLRGNGALNRTPLVVYTSADLDATQLPRLASGETVLFLAERSTSAEVQGRIVDLLAKIGTN